MVNITLSVPEDLKKQMDELNFVNWSAIFREIIKKRVLLLKQIKEFSKDSELSEDEAIRIGREVNKSLHKKYEKIRKNESCRRR